MGYIYKITNDIDKKIYIGQTRNNIKYRWENHQWKGKNIGKPDTDYPLYRAMNKYGLEHFSIEIVEQIEDEKLDEREIYWIKTLDCIAPKGYNCSTGGAGVSKYDKDLIIETFKKNNCHLTNTVNELGCSFPTVIKIIEGEGLESLGRYTAVYQISLEDGHIIQMYKSSIEAATEHNIAHNTLWCALNGERKTAAGYAWCRVDEYDNFNLTDHIDNKYRKVFCQETNLQFNTIKDASDWVYDNGYTTSKQINANICRACKKGIKAYGFHWQYV